MPENEAENEGESQSIKPTYPIYVVSGGAGASGELLLHTILAQFPDARTSVTVCPTIHTVRQVEEVAARAGVDEAIIVHTMVDRDLRAYLRSAAIAHHVPEVDLVGEMLGELTRYLHAEPVGRPGLYREFHNGYFKRIEAIDFAVKHDDGQRASELAQAEIVLLGVSRVGKTPLSIYLSLQGWKVANFPVVPGIPLPAELATVVPARVVGLTLAPAQLLLFRRSRQHNLGIEGGAYLEPRQVFEEVRAVRHLFGQRGFTVIDVTDKPIESTSEEVVAAVMARLSSTD